MIGLQRDFEEKRSFIRMKIDAPATIKQLHSEQVLNVICIDLSSSGVQFETDAPPPVGSRVEFQLHTPKDITNSLTAVIEVCRVMEVAPNAYRVGATIEHLF